MVLTRSVDIPTLGKPSSWPSLSGPYATTMSDDCMLNCMTVMESQAGDPDPRCGAQAWHQRCPDPLRR